MVGQRSFEDERAVNRQKLAADEAIVQGGLRHKVRANIGRLPFLEDAVAAFYCAVDRDTPLYVKAVLMAAVAYFVVPTDVIPDFIAGLGYTDDAAMLMAAIRGIGNNLKPRHHEQARHFIDKLKKADRPAP